MKHSARARIGGAIAALALAVLGPTAPAAGLIHGVDVSQWQYEIDWPTFVSQNQIDFAFIKYTDSSSLVDPQAVRNVEMAAAHGVPFGVYHFATPFAVLRNRQHFDDFDAAEEAAWFVQNARDYMGPGYLPPVVDMEFGERAGRARLTEWARVFLDTVEGLTGVRPMIYANQYWASTFLTASELDTELWIARWTNDPTVGPSNLGGWDDYLFHQYTSTLTLPGVTGNTVDGDVFNGDARAFAALLSPNGIPEPVHAAAAVAVALLFLNRHPSTA